MSEESSTATIGTEAEQPSAARDRPPIEIGFLLVGAFDLIDRDAIAHVRRALESEFDRLFPEFRWDLTLVPLPEIPQALREEPVSLLKRASEEREARRWDFAVLFTTADLISHYKPFAFAVLSRALDVAAVSTLRIDPRHTDPQVEQATRMDVLQCRLRVLVVHVLGHLNGLTHVDDASNYMFESITVDQLGDMQEFTHEQLDAIRENLRQIADQRMEENHDLRRARLGTFYLRSAWINRHELADAIWQAKPWEFPLRLSRLTTAAVSAAVVLMLTAETWDLALTQSLPLLAGFLVLALLLTTGYVVVRQRLLVRRDAHRVSEQTVVTNISGTVIVLCGMTTTAIVLLVSTLFAGIMFYRDPIIVRWAPAADNDFVDHIRVSMFVSALGIIIGALGASFEEQHHFQHTTFVDEET